MTLPRIIQGGMGIGVSDWRLAGAVGRAGGLGVVSGVALDSMLCRRLQDGDRDGQLRQALAQFPAPKITDKVLDRYFIQGGRPADQPYRLAPRLSLEPSLDRLRLAVVAAFAEVHLAKQAAHGAPVGINFLEKIQLATPAAAYGALLAGVDFVLVGAGIPARLPSLLDDLARHHEVDFPIDVAGAGSARHSIRFDPVATLSSAPETWSGRSFWRSCHRTPSPPTSPATTRPVPTGSSSRGRSPAVTMHLPAGSCSSTGAGIPSTAPGT